MCYTTIDDSGQPTCVVLRRPYARSLHQFVDLPEIKMLIIFMCMNTLQIAYGYMPNISYLEVQNANDYVRLPSSHVQVIANVDTVAK